jgi:hypothetical protein
MTCCRLPTIWRRTQSWSRGYRCRMRCRAGCRAERAPSWDKRRSAPLRLAGIVRCTPHHPYSLAAPGGCVGRNHCVRPASRWSLAGSEVRRDRVSLLHPEGPAVPRDRPRPSNPADLEGRAVRPRRVGLVIPAAPAQLEHRPALAAVMGAGPDASGHGPLALAWLRRHHHER